MNRTLTISYSTAGLGRKSTEAPLSRDGQPLELRFTRLLDLAEMMLSLVDRFMRTAKLDRESAITYSRVESSIHRLERFRAVNPLWGAFFDQLRQGTISINGMNLKAFTDFGNMLYGLLLYGINLWDENESEAGK